MVDLRKLDLSEANQDHEKSKIRLVDPTDPEELARLWEIEKDQNVAKMVGNIAHSDEDMISFTTNERDYLVLAVCGKEGHVEESEVNKLQGWISIYNEEKIRLARFAKEGVADLLTAGKRVLEIGFARHPRAKSGQMASALRQALALLQAEHKNDGEHELVVTAYAEYGNESSVRVLEAAGFVRVARVKYHLKNKNFDHFYFWNRN